jgi:glycosyltransferase involved in cell wall biosynthesis
MASPLATVIIDTYNHERFIEHALTSVLKQDAMTSDVEILVVDDGSTDGTPAAVKKFGRRVRYLRKENGGQASAFNAGIAEANAEIVLFLDGDDWWMPLKLGTVLEVFERNPKVGAVGHGITEAFGPEQYRDLLPDSDYQVHLGDVAGALRFRGLKAFMGTSRFAARKTVLQRLLPVPEKLIIEADEYLFTGSAAVSELAVLRQPLAYYRIHENNLFQFQGHDPVRMRRKSQALSELIYALPSLLARLGVAADVREKVIEPIWVDAERLRLTLDGGWSWETFCVEKKAFGMASGQAGVPYKILKHTFLALALLLPSRSYYGLRSWYAGMRQGQFGKCLPAAGPVTHLKQVWRTC